MFSLYNPLDSKNILENYPFKELKKGYSLTKIQLYH